MLANQTEILLNRQDSVVLENPFCTRIASVVADVARVRSSTTVGRTVECFGSCQQRVGQVVPSQGDHAQREIEGLLVMPSSDITKQFAGHYLLHFLDCLLWRPANYYLLQ